METLDDTLIIMRKKENIKTKFLYIYEKGN